jgi:hypothetical protein
MARPPSRCISFGGHRHAQIEAPSAGRGVDQEAVKVEGGRFVRPPQMRDGIDRQRLAGSPLMTPRGSTQWRNEQLAAGSAEALAQKKASSPGPSSPGPSWVGL